MEAWKSENSPRTSVGDRYLTSLRRIAAIALIGLVVGSCAGEVGQTDSTSPTGTSAGETTAAAGGQTDDGEETSLVFGVPVDMNGLDGNALSDRPGRFIRANVWETFLKRDVEGELGPNVLTSWEYNPDGFVWTLTMRDDITFHNGEHATSADLKATFDRMSNPDSEIYDDWWDVEETVIVDDYTVEMTLNVDNPLVFLRGDGYALNAKSWIDEVGPNLYTDTEPPPGSGPYRMLEWRQDDQIVMEAFEDHWNGAPPIDSVIFRIVPDDAARVAGLRSGELDVIFPIPPALAASISDPNLEIHEVKGTTRTRVQIDTREAPFDDIRVREALALAVDPQVILDELLPGFTRIPNMVNPEDVGFDPDLPFYEYDPERARELLAEAGYPDGIGPFELSVNEERLFSGDEHLVIAEQLAAAGIEVDVKVYPTDDFDTRLVEELGNPDSVGPLFLHGHSGGQTWHAAFTMSDIQPCGPDGTSVHEEHWHYCNDQAVEMVQESISLWPTDPEGSTEILKDVDRLLWEDFWAIPLWQVSENYGMKSNLNWVANSSLYMADASWDG